MTDFTANHLNEREDLPLATLLAVASEADERLPTDLVKKLYQSQKHRQFDTDRSASVQEMQRLLEEYVDSLIVGGTSE